LNEDPFEFVCQKAFREIKKFHQYYDLILIDEAQDFPQDFLRLCYEILKDDKRLVYAYDELQSLNSKVMDSPEVIFGNDNHGNPRVKLENLPSEPQQDVVLNTCYRNSRPILSSAHALGFPPKPVLNSLKNILLSMILSTLNLSITIRSNLNG